MVIRHRSTFRGHAGVDDSSRTLAQPKHLGSGGARSEESMKQFVELGIPKSYVTVDYYGHHLSFVMNRKRKWRETLDNTILKKVDG